eukprot:7659152-Prorocentrum_lima.AAC.1
MKQVIFLGDTCHKKAKNALLLSPMAMMTLTVIFIAMPAILAMMGLIDMSFLPRQPWAICMASLAVPLIDGCVLATLLRCAFAFGDLLAMMASPASSSQWPHP